VESEVSLHVHKNQPPVMILSHVIPVHFNVLHHRTSMKAGVEDVVTQATYLFVHLLWFYGEVR
jgi:hypothetical protein